MADPNSLFFPWGSEKESQKGGLMNMTAGFFPLLSIRGKLHQQLCSLRLSGTPRITVNQNLSLWWLPRGRWGLFTASYPPAPHDMNRGSSPATQTNLPAVTIEIWWTEGLKILGLQEHSSMFLIWSSDLVQSCQREIFLYSLSHFKCFFYCSRECEFDKLESTNPLSNNLLDAHRSPSEHW